jgi:hypothetical protein
MIRFLSALLACCSLLLLSGCAGYNRGSIVPEQLRTIHVPAFENQTNYPMVGSIAAQQFLDTLIEDGTFKLAPYDTARLRVQVVIKDIISDSIRYDRNNAILPTEYYMTLSAHLYVYDATTGQSYIEGKPITATESMLTRDQYQTSIMDTLPRLSRRLAKALLDELQTIQ